MGSDGSGALSVSTSRPAVAAAARFRRHAHGGGKQKGSLAAGSDIGELARRHTESLLGGVVHLRLRQAQAAQRTPNKVEVLVDHRPHPRAFGLGTGRDGAAFGCGAAQTGWKLDCSLRVHWLPMAGSPLADHGKCIPTPPPKNHEATGTPNAVTEGSKTNVSRTKGNATPPCASSTRSSNNAI